MDDPRTSPTPPKLTAAESVSAGAVVGGYVVERRLGRGGAATVYLARDPRHGRHVALKLLHPELASSDFSKRFLREIAVMAGLHHAHLVPILDSGETNGVPFYVMPYVEGEGLRDRLARERQLPVEDVVRIGREAADALQHVHAHGVVHRDLKPENLLVGNGHTFVADFGISYAIARAGTDRLTSSEMILGTPMYMSPEQAAGERDLDGRSDQYSLACVLYELLAGMPPFVGVTREAVIAQRFAHTPLPVTAHRPHVPPHVDAALRRAMALTPADRFPSMERFAAALAGGGVVDTPPVTARSRLARRWRAPALLLGAAAVAGGGLTALRPAWRAWFAPAADARAVDPRRIAVLDFEVRGGGRDVADFAAGVRDALLVELSGVSALAVVSGGSDACRAAPTACEARLDELRVGSLVRASVERADSSYRVTVHLVDRVSGVELSTGAYDHHASRRTPERELAPRIAVAIRRRLGREARVREATLGTADTLARGLVARAERLREDALAMVDRPGREDLRTAVTALGRADSLLARARHADPRWVRPLLGRGWLAHDLAGLSPAAARLATLGQGVAYADSALAADPTNARGLELRGALRWAIVELLDPQVPDSAQLRLAEQDLRDAVDRDSTLARGWATLSELLYLNGQIAEAEITGRRAYAHDVYLEHGRRVQYALFFNALMLGDYRAATDACARGRRRYPEDWQFVQCELTLMRHDPGARPDPAGAWRLVAELEVADPPDRTREGGNPYPAIYRRIVAATVSAAAGQRDVARVELARARRATAGDRRLQLDLAYDEAFLLAALGERAEAARRLRELLDARPMLRPMLARDPLLRRAGLAAPGH